MCIILQIKVKVYNISVDIDYLLTYIELKLLQLLKDLVLFLHFYNL